MLSERPRDVAAPTTVPPADPAVEARALFDRLGDVLAYARERDYRGWDYADGMSSRIRRALPVENRWVNLAFQETAKRAPVNLRPLLLVEQRRNFKGTGLFAMANLGMARHAAAMGRRTTVDYRGEARDLLDWLLVNRCPGFDGFCGGHRHATQDLSGRVEPDDPDVVSTAYAGRALLAGGELNALYPAAARTAAAGREHFGYERAGSGLEIDYHARRSTSGYTINAGAVWAGFLLDCYARFGDERHRERARDLLDRVADLQTPVGGWYYRDPPDSSHLSMDNHHNGFVIEAFQRYHDVTGTDRYEETLSEALAFYREALFEESGAPNFDEANAYPRDIHAATQGVLVFTYAGDLAFASRILAWTLDALHAGDGRFYFRKHRYHTKRHVLMRWCQAWMAYAISEYLDAVIAHR
jgi:hypothetical protein